MKRLLSLLCLMGIMFAFQARLYGMDVSFQLVVVNGTADKVGMMVQANQTVTITANSYADKVFSQWVCNDNVELADATAAQTTFIMPLFPVTVIAMYKPTVTVVDGVADKAAAAEGETVTITADEPAEDEEFDKWVGDGVEFENANDVQTSFVMPAAAVTVRATYRNKTVAPLYMVVYDLDKTEWKIRYTNDAPDLSKDACRTTELWLRYIPAGKFTMGSPEDEPYREHNEVQHKVTLTQPFFIGVFECTQKQWELIMGGRPDCYFRNDDYYATRPVETVSYDMIRGSTGDGVNWPTTEYDVAESSFMGVLRARTGLTFDLPTEAQWEYACRAGTTTALNSGEYSSDENMAEVGRYYYNGGKNSLNDQDCDTTKGTAKVGSYRPNNWELYDMHGNVFEWCLDWYDSYGTEAILNPSGPTPIGPIAGWNRVIRGGWWYIGATGCRSAFRASVSPSERLKSIGFRVLCLIPPETYAVTVVDGTADKTTAAEGETVTITANEPANYEVFDKWVGEGVEFADENAAETTFTMPAAAVTVTATYKAKISAPLYMVVYDLDKTEWKVRYTDDGPDLTGDACRTTELWLRYIPAGKFMMGSPAGERGRNFTEVQHEVTLTQPYYIGVFECTQKQWELVMGNKPSYFNNDDYYATRPVEQVSYDDIRGSKSVANWPADGNTVGDTSFMGILRAGTGLTFDLPTSAQWEYACRAGTKTALNSDVDLENKGKDAAMGDVGRYFYNGGKDFSSNGDTTVGTAKVGSYRKNNWGLYDMHGNVWEWCLDWWDGSPYDASSAEDPAGDKSGSTRVFRGGSWLEEARGCRSACHDYISPSIQKFDRGFRVVCLIPPETYAVTVIDGTADKTEAAEGDTITIIADEPADDEEFDKWTSDDGVEFEDANAAQTTFTMPAAAVTVTATYKAKAPATHAVTVVKGTADKTEAAEGETVTITADMPGSGKTFDKWTGRGVAFENAAAPVTTFEMPANDVTVTATFKKLPSVKTYKITVVNGKADKAKAAVGETVTLTANPPPAGKVFDRWTGGAAFEDATSPTTTFVMPAKAVTPKALYKRK